MAYDGPEQTAAVRALAVSDSIDSLIDTMKRNPERTDLHDVGAVQRMATIYMETCRDKAILPTLEGFACVLGVNRRWIYQFIKQYPESASAMLIRQLQTGWAAVRIAATDRGAADKTMSIFLLLNSDQGYTNEHQITIEPPRSPLDTLKPEAARLRHLDALPPDDDV